MNLIDLKINLNNNEDLWPLNLTNKNDCMCLLCN